MKKRGKRAVTLSHETYWRDFFDRQAKKNVAVSERLCFSSEENRQSIYNIILSLTRGYYERVLDVGAGTGYLSLKLLSQCSQIVALDISLDMLQLLRERLPRDENRVTICHGSITDPPFPGSYFDLIVASEILQYVPFFPTVFHMIDLLRPKGILIASIPHKTHPIIISARKRRHRLFNGIGIEELEVLFKKEGIRCSVMPLFLIDNDKSYNKGNMLNEMPTPDAVKGANRLIIRIVRTAEKCV